MFPKTNLCSPVGSSHPTTRWGQFLYRSLGCWSGLLSRQRVTKLLQCRTSSNGGSQRVQRCSVLDERNKTQEAAVIVDRASLSQFRKGSGSFRLGGRFHFEALASQSLDPLCQLWRERGPIYLGVQIANFDYHGHGTKRRYSNRTLQLGVFWLGRCLYHRATLSLAQTCGSLRGPRRRC
jgi:hypothetical protein